MSPHVPLRRQGPRPGLELQRKSGHAPRVKAGFVYIMASGRNGTLYIGVTSDLVKRAWEHRNGVVAGFTRKYGCKLLVWYEAHDDLEQARMRELQIKKWKRLWKLREIEEMNPEWQDLYPRLPEGS
jgi:putative endonuclease